MNQLFTMICFVFFTTIYSFASTKINISESNLINGETLTYKARWGVLTIGTASSKVDKKLYKIGNKIAYKIDLNGKTNGLARLFYLNDNWNSYIDTKSFTTLKSFRSIHEGNYKLQEIVYFDHDLKRANSYEFDFLKKQYTLKNSYNTPINIRDVVAGFMLIRLINFSNLNIGDKFIIDGFYKKEGYKIELVYYGKQVAKTNKGNQICYKIKPLIPKNRVFDGLDAVTVWLSADKSQKILKIEADLYFGKLIIDLQ